MDGQGEEEKPVDSSKETNEELTKASSNRLRSLKMWKALMNEGGLDARLTFKDGTETTATVTATDGKQSAFHVKNLKTKIGVYPTATVRGSDLMYMEMNISETLAKRMCPDVRKALAHLVDDDVR